MAENILLIGGSLNQTTIMHQIAVHLKAFRYNCYFSPFYADGFLGILSQRGMLDFSILGGRHLQNTLAYIARHKLPMDYGGCERNYDLVITSTDLVVPKNIRGKRLVLVQEGMTEPEDLVYQLVRFLKLPRFLANTSATGLSDAYDLFCVASQGYHDLFVHKGVRSDKIAVTGIPNFDHAEVYRHNEFPHRDFALVATSSMRETFKPDDRPAFIQRALKIANGRRVIFKLHPNENIARATKEIRAYAPEALIITEGNINYMIANCAVLITQRSSVVYVGLALGKEVHSYYDVNQLRQMLPIQNGGDSARQIAYLCEQLVRMPQVELAVVRSQKLPRPAWRLPNTA